MAEDSPTLECGFCLRQNVASSDSKTLPCSHVHCLECLTGYFEINNILKCPVQECGEVFDEPPDALPSYYVEEDDFKLCDVCVKEKMSKQAAVMYCTVCSRTFCIKHLESHDVTMDDHTKMGLDEYGAQAKSVQTGNCTKHEDQPYTTGCICCLTIACPDCIPDIGDCSVEESHYWLTLEELADYLLDQYIIYLLTDREEQFETLFKETSKVRSEHDSKTIEMVKLIHQTRDAQSKDSDKLKYKKLEDELLEKRHKSSVDIAEFMENIVFEKWTKWRNYRLQTESRVKYNPADFVKGFQKLKEEVQRFIDGELPGLKLTDVVQLRQRGSELEIVPSLDIAVDIPPETMTLIKSVDLPSDINCACMYKGSAYFGLWKNTVTIIDSNYEFHNSFITCSGGIRSITIHKDKIYILMEGDPNSVNVYDMSGEHITSWVHPYSRPWWDTTLIVVGDKILIGEPHYRRIRVYSLNGDSLPDIPCSSLSNSFTAMCAVDNLSVVICVRDARKLYRHNVCTGEVMWVCSTSMKPELVVCHGGHILVTEDNSSTICVHRSTTGEMVSDVYGEEVAGDDNVGLWVCGTTLLVAKPNYQLAYFYRLSTKSF